MVFGFVKRTASRKPEQSKLRRKDVNSPTNSRSFKELLVNERLETSCSPSYTSKVYHVEFPLILKELEVMTVQFLGGDNCMINGRCLIYGLPPSA